MNRIFVAIASQIEQFTLIAVGAIPGALLRFYINSDFWSNTLGCALLGLIIAFRVNSSMKILLMIGFCGSFTSFAGWVVNLLNLIGEGFILQAAMSLFSVLIGGFVALGFGFVIGKRICHTFHP